MENLVKYSASDLIKKSCRQIIFLRNKKEQIISRMQLKGTQFQSKISEEIKILNKGIIAEELRGVYNYDNITIFFCIDLYVNNCFYEIKSIFDKNGNESLEYEDWYLNNSLLQCAFYKSLLMLGENNTLFTPKFRLKEGFEFKAQPINKYNDYFLIFGNVEKYKIEVTNPEEIIYFYKQKIEHLKNYDCATIFDSKYKRKEFDFLKKYFKYTIYKDIK